MIPQPPRPVVPEIHVRHEHSRVCSPAASSRQPRRDLDGDRRRLHLGRELHRHAFCRDEPEHHEQDDPDGDLDGIANEGVDQTHGSVQDADGLARPQAFVALGYDAHAGFELARRRRGRLCSIDKANVMESG